MAPVEPEDRVFVSEEFLSSVHGQIGCVSCHGGDPNTALTKEAKAQAHSVQADFVAYPGEQFKIYCGSCHSDITSDFEYSLHFTQNGYYERFKIRAGGQDLRDDSKMAAGFQQACAKCHAGCGQCHVIRPISVNSGLVSAHKFYRTPDLVENCTACHGSRVGEEYRGLHAGEKYWQKGIKADVHYNKGYRCDFCHDASEMHGDGNLYSYRLVDNADFVARCEDCHPIDENTENNYHKTHVLGDKTLQCQICHSQTYKSCNGCHVGEGITGRSYPTFKIGKNYLKDRSAFRKYDYVLVRHIPIAPDTYDNWGGSISLSSFETAPTWKYATPHNIQRRTPQTDTTGTSWCGQSCHGNFDNLLLTPADVDSAYLDAELKANEPVFVK
ncbi:MAG: hypothetical protein GXO77_16325 [Calditrichaeota bacterium]|nr:hypothetical protein [Calditrichota bacterium]